MNNKLFARIMTAVICICMMSTVCFAAAPELVDGDDATTKKINFVDGTSNWLAAEGTADQVTMMAYLVPAGTAIADAAYVDETNTPMIAIDQYDADALATTVSVLASKLVEGKDIVLQKGDSNGGGAKMIIAQEVIDDKVVITVINGADSIEVEADADGNVTLPATAEFAKQLEDSFTFTLYSWVTEDGAIEYEAGEEVAATALKDVTLYAKFVSDYSKGDVNMDGDITEDDVFAAEAAFLGTGGDGLWGYLIDTEELLIGGVLSGNDITEDDVFALEAVFLGTANDELWEPYYFVSK